MNLAFILRQAKSASKLIGYRVYIIHDTLDDSYAFTQQKDIFLLPTQSIVKVVDRDTVTVV